MTAPLETRHLTKRFFGVVVSKDVNFDLVSGEATRGINVSAKLEVYELVNRLAARMEKADTEVAS